MFCEKGGFIVKHLRKFCIFHSWRFIKQLTLENYKMNYRKETYQETLHLLKLFDTQMNFLEGESNAYDTKGLKDTKGLFSVLQNSFWSYIFTLLFS